MSTDAKVMLWGRWIGAVSWDENREVGVFEYTPEFLNSNIQVSPLKMPLPENPESTFYFPDLPRITFKGLPGLLADSLPDKYGDAIINAWLSSQGRDKTGFNPVERLCYIGKRGMGALEFEPAIFDLAKGKGRIEVARLVDLASRVLNKRAILGGIFTGNDDREAINNILRVGTSAGGARAKAILAWNPETDEFRSGQIGNGKGFQYWIMKFDGVSSSSDTEMSSPKGYGKIEYVYYLMAREAGITMANCRLHHEGGRSHFMTKRFDRSDDGGKFHMQTLGALAHFDYRQPARYSYEQAIHVCKRLKLSRNELNQLVLRAFFNVVARNCDDHVKNIAFLMDKTGKWSLAPAYDMTYAWNPTGEWTSHHQMSMNNKNENFERNDLITFAEFAGIKKPQANQMIDKVVDAVKKWPDLASKTKISDERISKIKNSHIVEL